MKRPRVLALLACFLLALSTTARTQDADLQCPCTLFGNTVPAKVDVGPDSAVELGVKFKADVDGHITGIRFYKSTANVGPHFGKLWSSAGVALGTVSFDNETASGWQEAHFATPVAVQAGVTYVASYNAPTGHYAFTADYFATEWRNGPLVGVANSATSGNGVFIYGSEMPRNSYRAANYWVDVIFQPPTTAAPAVLTTLPAAGATNAAPPITATFNREMNSASIVLRVQRPDGSLVAGTVSYDDVARAAQFVPLSPLAGATTYTATVEGSASTGEPMAAPHSWTFTTAAVGFKDTVVLSGLQQPTTFRMTPGGEIFVAEKSGIIKVFQGFSDSTPIVFADLRTQVHNFWDRGLLGLALHPQFPAQPYVYVAYSRDAVIGGQAPLYGTPDTTSDPCPSPQGALADGCIISARVSRLRAVAVPDGYQMTGAEEVLVDGWGQQYPSHSIGAIEFGADGMLYVTGGEGASYSFVDYGQRGNPPNPLGDSPVAVGEAQTPPSAEGGALRSQSLQRAAGGPVLLNGMVLRIDPNTGAGLADNPLGSSPDANARRVLAEGLRNPYRFTLRPGTTEVWVGDVGWNSIEEINRIPASPARVLNFGWPCYEGYSPQPAYESTGLTICQTLYATVGSVDRPAFQYQHYSKLATDDTCGTGSSAVAGLAFYEGGAYPSNYNGALFFADYARRCVWAALPDASGQVDFAKPVTILDDAESPVELRVGPGGDLFYVDIGWGTIHRIQYLAASEDRTLTASFTATPNAGPAPLTVAFDGRGSLGTNLTYQWDFGDGTAPVIAGPEVSHTYALGDYVARLLVTDANGATAATSRSISATPAPPTPVIDTPTAALRWAVGDTVSFSGHASDPLDGALAASQLTWTVGMNHCSDDTHCHLHTVQEYAGVASGSFVAPDHEYPAHLVLMLTARNSRGISASTSLRLDPRTVDLTFATAPAGLSLAIGSEAAVAPITHRVIVGSIVSVAAGATQTMGGSSYTFARWSDGGAAAHQVIAPGADTTYTATYDRVASSELTLFGAAVPAVIDAGADSPVELGVKFRADTAGTVAGVRFYKSAGNVGTHVGSLWSATGTRLAFVTFTSETASGWQEARFATPVAISANTTYVVSYHSTGGHYSYTSNFFGVQHDAGVLHALASGGSANGVFKYGAAGTFPTSGYNASNYWVDVLFTSTPDTIAPAITAKLPAAGAVGVAVTERVKATFSEPMSAASIGADTIVVTTESGTRVAGAVGYDDATTSATFTPSSSLIASTRYLVRVAGGTSASAARDRSGNPLQSDVTWAFDTAAAAGDGCPCSLFPATLSPAIADAGGDSPVELGVKFKANVDGTILGIRFLKAAANTGTHVGSLWTSSGTRLAYATFTAESGSGWQEARFASPVAITAGTIYVASYHTTVGHYSLTSGFFNNAWTNGPLTAPASSTAPNGVFRYGAAGQFPTGTYGAANYFVDVLFSPAAADTTPPGVTATAPAAGQSGVAVSTAISATFSEAMDPASLTSTSFALRDAQNVPVAGTVSYDAATRTARFTPSSPLRNGTAYTATLAGQGSSAAAPVRDTSGNALAADVAWTFTTAVDTSTDNGPFSLWTAAAVPAVIDAGADSSVELGVRFKADTSGYIRAIRFYKSAGNSGTHVVSLWTAAGVLLAQKTAVGESASGWQEVALATPVAVSADTVYVASYHVNGGHYSYTSAYFTAARDAGVLHAPAGSNGVFAYGSTSRFPSSSHNSTNYWVDVVFTRQ